MTNFYVNCTADVPEKTYIASIKTPCGLHRLLFCWLMMLPHRIT